MEDALLSRHRNRIIFMMTSQEGFNVDNEGPVLDPTSSDDSPFIANAAELERFAS